MLNNFIRFERQLYQVFGLELGRPLRLKAVMYFFAIAIVEATLYFTPGIGRLINWIPVGILILIPIGLAWLLADVGTEGRSPVYFFRSFIFYQARRMKDSTLYRGRQVDKERDYQFHNYYTYRSPLLKDNYSADLYSEIEKEHERVMEYLARIANREGLENDERGVGMEVDDEIIPKSEETKQDKPLQKQSKPFKKQLNQNPVTTIGLIILFTSVLSIVLAFAILYLMTDFEFDKANATTNDAETVMDWEMEDNGHHMISLEEHLVAGLRAASIQKYSVAVEHFDKLDFDKLEKADRNAVLFTYLISDNAQKALDYAPDFDKSIVNFFIAKDEIERLKRLETDSELIAFEVAALNKDHEKIIEYQSADRLEMDERRSRLIVDAYLTLNQIEEAYDFAKRINDDALRSYIQTKEENPTNNKSEKVNGESGERA